MVMPESPGIKTAVLSAVVSAVATAGTIGVAFLGGFFQVANTKTANEGTVTLERLKFSNELVKDAIKSENATESLEFYADIGLLEGLKSEEIKKFAERERQRLREGGKGPSLLPTFDKSARPVFWLTREMVDALAPGNNEDAVDALVTTGNYILQGFEIDKTSRRLAAFLGQVAYETSGLKILEENADFSKESLLRKFPRIFDDVKAAEYAHNPERILNVVYANQLGNGGEESGDGWRYRGRGFMQIAGKANYQRIGEQVGIDLLKSPDLAGNPHVSLLIAAAYWYYAGLNDAADNYDIVAITKRINGGSNGLEQRKRYSDAARELLEKITSD